MPPLTATISLISISTALIASGGIATLSLFDIPELKSQPASRSLPSIRWLFSRGSHIFPTAALISSGGFAYLAYTALPATVSRLPLLETLKYGRVPGHLLAALLTFGIAPWTQVMIPTNFRLIEINEKLGGARSARSAKEGEKPAGGKSVEQSTSGEGDISQWSDLSGPMERTGREASAEEEKEVKELLGKFARLNIVRAALMGVGGMVGLWTALV